MESSEFIQLFAKKEVHCRIRKFSRMRSRMPIFPFKSMIVSGKGQTIIVAQQPGARRQPELSGCQLSAVG
jgi:hypothetical protein